MNEMIAEIANISLALSFVVAIVFGIAEVRSAGRDRRERLALDVLNTFQSREFAELMRFILTSTFPKTRAELFALPKEETIMFTQLAQQMETLGLMVSTGAVSIELIERTHGSFITMAWDKYKEVFMSMRENPESPDPYLGEYFQWLAERVDEQIKNHPRQPFYAVKK